MITVKNYNEICQQIIAAIEISGYVICSTEDQGLKKLKDKAGIRMVAVYPNYSFEGGQDTYKARHELLFFIVLKQNEGSTDQVELDQYSDTQDAMIRLKEYLFNESTESITYCHLFPGLDIKTVNIIPEYNVFGGYLGWSMALEV